MYGRLLMNRRNWGAVHPAVRSEPLDPFVCGPAATAGPRDGATGAAAIGEEAFGAPAFGAPAFGGGTTGGDITGGGITGGGVATRGEVIGTLERELPADPPGAAGRGPIGP
jgi:hypothetical protein